ncbi:ROK family transcriptional regulator [Saccharothrix deserti]|uniref:ROK family transcriptional regulator n=1 Tax=Saccharothrix deserti TaxID=2593674 RepID=UPI00131C14F8|nr:ROK family transcriptional regulator [Saccharothrix deserti]
MQAQTEGRREVNLALLLRTLRARGPLSRAQLAAGSGLSKATVSPLLTNLEQRGLTQRAGTTTTQGRPGQLIRLRPGAVCGIGLDVHPGHLGATVTDLTGEVHLRRQAGCDTSAPEHALDQLADLTRKALMDVATADWAGVTVAIPGRADRTTGTATATRLRWRDVAVVDGLAARTGLPITRLDIDNEANLAACAEHDTDPVDNLVYLHGDHSVAAGVIANGVLVRGADNRAGEVGHVVLDPLGGTYCACGTRGCWETQVGLDAFLHACAPLHDQVHNPELAQGERMSILRTRAERGDARTLDALHRTAAALSAGLSVLTSLLNPQKIVLGGYFAALQDWLVAPQKQGKTPVTASTLGFAAGARGAALAALRRVLDDPTVVPVKEGTPKQDSPHEGARQEGTVA